MYCESCGKATDGGRCAACGRRPARLSLNVFSLLMGWWAILSLYVVFSTIYPWLDDLFTGLNAQLPLPTRVIVPIARPFGSGVVALVSAGILLVFAIALRRFRADKWLAAVSFLLALLQVLGLISVAFPAMSLVHKLAR